MASSSSSSSSALPKAGWEWKQQAKRKADEQEAKQPFSKKRKLQKDEARSVGPITSVVFPRIVPVNGCIDQRTNVLLTIRGKLWAGNGFLSLDQVLYEHTVEGILDAGKSAKYNKEQYKIQNIMSESVCMVENNYQRLFALLLGYTFNADQDDWTPADVQAANEAIAAVPWSTLTSEHQPDVDKSIFRFDVWLRQQAIDEQAHWAQIMFAHRAVQVYCVLLSTGKLLKHYPLSRICSLTFEQRRQLIEQLKEPYLLCFQDMYEERFPDLPELRLSTLEKEELEAIGLEKLLNVWCYHALRLNQDISKSTYCKFMLIGKRTFVALATARKQDVKSHHADVKGAICRALSVDEYKTFPDRSTGCYQAILRRLHLQGTVILESIPKTREGRVHLWSTLRRSMFIAGFLRRLALLDAPPRTQFQTAHLLNAPTESKNADSKKPTDGKDSKEDRKRQTTDSSYSTSDTSLDEDLDAAMEAAERRQTKQRERKKDRIRALDEKKFSDEQHLAMHMIEINRASCMMGRGGCGKSEVISRIPGRPEQKWLGENHVAAKHPDEFFLMRPSSKDGKTPPIYGWKGEKVILTPTGVSATNVNQREAEDYASSTAHLLLARWKFGHGRDRYDQLRTIITDEHSMVDETITHDVLEAANEIKPMERIVIVGDPGQLAPVGLGQPLTDILKTDFPRTKLTKNFRVSEDAKLLAQNLEHVANQACSKLEYRDGVFAAVQQRNMSRETIFQKYRSVDGLQACQIICHTNACKDEWNDFWMKSMGFIVPSAGTTGGPPSRQRTFFAGQKIMFRKNSNDPKCPVNNGRKEIIHRIIDSAEIDLFVGDQAYLFSTADREKSGRSIRSTLEPLSDVKGVRRFFECESGFIFQATSALLSTMEPAYCVTVHSMQSLGVDHIIFWDDDSTLYDKLVYTAASRSQKSFTFVTSSRLPTARLEEAMCRPEPPRLTMLADLMRAKSTDDPYCFHTICSNCAKEMTWAPDLVLVPNASRPLCPSCKASKPSDPSNTGASSSSSSSSTSSTSSGS